MKLFIFIFISSAFAFVQEKLKWSMTHCNGNAIVTNERFYQFYHNYNANHRMIVKLYLANENFYSDIFLPKIYFYHFSCTHCSVQILRAALAIYFCQWLYSVYQCGRSLCIFSLCRDALW